MRRSRLQLPAVAAVAVLGLTACSDDELDPDEVPAPIERSADQGEPEPSGGPGDVGVGTGAATDGPGDATDAPTDAPDGGSAPAADAASERAQEWLRAYVNADPAVCDYVLNFEGDGAMSDLPADLEFCQDAVLPGAEAAFDEEMAAIMSAVTITGAQIEEGEERAVVDQRHVSELFAGAIGDDQIVLVLVQGQWLVDLDQSFRAS